MLFPIALPWSEMTNETYLLLNHLKKKIHYWYRTLSQSVKFNSIISIYSWPTQTLMMLTMFRKTEKKTTKIPTTALSSVTFPTLHLVIYSLLLTFSQPHVQRQEQSKEDLKIAASAERSLCSIWEWARFNNSSLNTNEIKYSGLQGSLSDDHCFENPSFSPPGAPPWKPAVFSRWTVLTELRRWHQHRSDGAA